MMRVNLKRSIMLALLTLVTLTTNVYAQNNSERYEQEYIDSYKEFLGKKNISDGRKDQALKVGYKYCEMAAQYGPEGAQQMLASRLEMHRRRSFGAMFSEAFLGVWNTESAYRGVAAEVKALTWLAPEVLKESLRQKEKGTESSILSPLNKK
jgi:hypothetical protein